MKRSPASAPISRSTLICAQPAPPGTISPASSSATRAGTSSAPRWRCTCVQWRSGGCPDSTRSCASKRRSGACSEGASSHMPRATASRSTPASASAMRCPAPPLAAGASCTRRLRTRTGVAGGDRSSESPTLSSPENAVPVTTVPAPLSVKQRSMARRKPPLRLRSPSPAAQRSRCARKAAIPSPRVASTGKTGAAASGLPGIAASSSATSACASAKRSGETRSILVKATAPWRMPSSSTISRCSRVCGIGPSSAAITSSAKSIPVAPASMLCTSFSCPGTSTKPSTPPPGSGA